MRSEVNIWEQLFGFMRRKRTPEEIFALRMFLEVRRSCFTSLYVFVNMTGFRERSCGSHEEVWSEVERRRVVGELDDKGQMFCWL